MWTWRKYSTVYNGLFIIIVTCWLLSLSLIHISRLHPKKDILHSA